jgi:hypothetical protein
MEAAAVPGIPLLERSEELARIESALARARTGQGAFLVLEGQAGIGKTAVLSAARTLALGQDMRVLRSRGAELERDFAFGVVRQLFEPVLADASAPERADWLQGAAGVAAGLLNLPGGEHTGGTGAGVDPSFAIPHGSTGCVQPRVPACALPRRRRRALGRRTSLRYSPSSSHGSRSSAWRSSSPAPPRELGAEADLLATITADPSAEIVRLAPRLRAAVEHFVETAFGSPPEPGFSEACLRATRGTPFLLRALVEALTEEGITPDAASAPHVERIGARTIGRSLRLRLARLPEPARRLARAVAVLEAARSDCRCG